MYFNFSQKFVNSLYTYLTDELQYKINESGCATDYHEDIFTIFKTCKELMTQAPEAFKSSEPKRMLEDAEEYIDQVKDEYDDLKRDCGPAHAKRLKAEAKQIVDDCKQLCKDFEARVKLENGGQSL